MRKERVKSELRDLLKGNVGNGNAGGRGRVKAKEAGAGKKDGEEMTPEDRYELLRACLEAEEDPCESFVQRASSCLPHFVGLLCEFGDAGPRAMAMAMRH